MTDTVKDGTLRTRRSLLTAAAGGAAALAVSAIKPGTATAAVANVQTDSNNASAALTSISNATDGIDSFAANATGDGTGATGNSDSGVGVMGVSDATNDPGTNTRNAGVVGVAGQTSNVSSNIALTGVYGVSDPSPDPDNFTAAGVWGESGDIGVIGSGTVGLLGDGGIGVVGVSGASDGFGVLAQQDADDALALGVAGRAVFSRSGKTTVKAGNKSKTVNLADCTAQTLVIAVLASNRDGRYVRAAVPSGGSFKIYLNANVSSDTKVSWLAFSDPATLLG
jgi:hypothetical protein